MYYVDMGHRQETDVDRRHTEETHIYIDTQGTHVDRRHRQTEHADT